MKPLWIICIIFFITAIGYNLASSFFPLYMQSKGLDKFQIGLAYGMLPLLTVVTGIYIGALVDRFRIKKLISLAILGYLSFIILFSISFNFITFLASFILIGISNAMLWVSGRSFILNLPDVPKASSYFFTTVYITSIIGPLFGGKIIEIFGYGNLFLISPVIIFVAVVVTILFFREKPVKILKKKIRKQKIKWDLLLKIGIPIIIMAILTNLLFFLPIFLKIKDFGETEIGIIISFGSLLITAFQIPAGRIVSRIYTRKSIFIGFVLTALGTFLLMVLSNTMLQILFCFVPATLGLSILSIANFDAIGKILKQKGKAAGIYETILNSGSWSGSIINGFIFQVFGYSSFFLFLVLISIFGSLSSFAIKINRKQTKI